MNGTPVRVWNVCKIEMWNPLQTSYVFIMFLCCWRILFFFLQWIYNILEHKKEEDRIVFEDPDPELGFILLPDMKWTGEQMEDLYLQAIVRRRDLTSIRDLRGNHIPLLKNIMKKGTVSRVFVCACVCEWISLDCYAMYKCYVEFMMIGLVRPALFLTISSG